MLRVEVKPEMLRWAVERSRVDAIELAARFPQLETWARQDRRPTLRQLERFARATHTPVGFLFLTEPPAESVPIPDFRTIADREVGRPSPNLLDTIYHCQVRQDWYRDYAVGSGNGALPEGRRVSSFAFEPHWSGRPWPPKDKYDRIASDAELGLLQT